MDGVFPEREGEALLAPMDLRHSPQPHHGSAEHFGLRTDTETELARDVGRIRFGEQLGEEGGGELRGVHPFFREG